MQGYPACSASYALIFTQSKEEEIEWLKKSARAGYMNAQLMLAYAYAKGDGVTQDFSLARCWVNEAVIQSKTIYAASDAQVIRGVENDAKREGKKVVIKHYRPGANCSELEN